ncbi:uncharacterized protein [Eurosta solidaginis]|uniref:uncharacterized protein n=1 Tax=Eurosta solidaginis TaxID=178769 RepID=UPI0035313265
MLAAPYHSAIRRSLHAFPTSPIKNLLAESGLPFLRDNMEDSTIKLYPRIILGSNITLQNALHSTSSRIRSPKIESAIYKCATFAKTNNLPLKPPKLRKLCHPPWLISKETFIDNLVRLPKNTTPNAIYIAEFRIVASALKHNSWRFIYTDGSKNTSTSFTVVSEKGKPISYGLLFPFCSIFIAEASAIFHAVLHASKNSGKYVICTDSLSCFQAIQNCNNLTNVINSIREYLILYQNKIKLMWVPSHTGITGNSYADELARDASNAPTITVSFFTKSDIYRLINERRHSKLAIDWISYNHHYAIVNSAKVKPVYPSTIPANILTPYIRLRIGHTIATHAHLLGSTTTNCCPFYNDTAT